MDVCVDNKHVCGLELHSNHSRRQFYDILYARSVTKEVDFGTDHSNHPETETEKALIDEWVAIKEEIHFDDFQIGKYISDDRIIIAIAYEFDISFASAVSLLYSCEDIYEECATRRRQHCICGEYSKLYPIINKNTKRVLLVGSTCIKTVHMSSISSLRCVQCGKSTKGSDSRFGRCADCIHDPHFVFGSHKGDSIMSIAIGNNTITHCIKDDKLYFHMAVDMVKMLRKKINEESPIQTRRVMRKTIPQESIIIPRDKLATIGKTTFDCGKYYGETFKYVYETYEDYVRWVKKCANPYGDIESFKNYVLSMDSAIASSSSE